MRSAILYFLLAGLIGTVPAQAQSQGAPHSLTLVPGKSLVLESPEDIQRVSVGSAEVAEAIGISPREVLVNAKKPGDTSVILWQQGGGKLLFDLAVREKDVRTATVKRELAREFEGQNVEITVEGETVFLRGTVDDMSKADRAFAIASTLGKPVNLLRVKTPEGEPQILLKVRFANVDRAVGSDLGVNLFSTGATNTIGSVSTGAYSPAKPIGTIGGDGGGFSLSDALNIFLFRPDLNLGATIKALETRRLVEILAEPNLLASNGKAASFLAGGEFPYPVVQGGGGGFTSVTIQFREFGIRINFTPTITARGTIRLQVSPEVSALDYANGLVYQGFNIPALASKKVQTEIELDDRQSFAIAGLLDNRMTENLSKIPGLSSIPLIGRLFQSRQQSKSKTELMVLVTPELVRPIPRDQKPPELDMPKEFLKGGSPGGTRTPGIELTGTAAPAPGRPATLPVEQLQQERRAYSPAPAASIAAQPMPAAVAAPPKN